MSKTKVNKTLAADGVEPTPYAVEQCRNWLAACIQLGWRSEQIAALEKLWWEHHNSIGEIE